MEINDLERIAQARYEHGLAKKNLRERIEQQLTFAHGLGLFRASPELISFLNCWDEDVLVIEDLYHNPVQIDRRQMLEQARQCYQYALNAWHTEYQQLCQTRRAADV